MVTIPPRNVAVLWQQLEEMQAYLIHVQLRGNRDRTTTEYHALVGNLLAEINDLRNAIRGAK